MAEDLLEVKLERLRYLKELREKLSIADDIEKGVYRPPWSATRRPEQEPPPGDWHVWVILAGRGWGKTRTAVEWALEKARRYPGCRIALVAATIADARDTLVEGESGLLNCVKKEELRGGTEESAWNRSLVEVFFANGSYVKGYCVAPHTRILTSDLRYVPASEIVEGMELAAFEKDPVGRRRHFASACVESAERISQPCYKLILEDGTELICSDEHLWLTCAGDGPPKWTMTKNLRVGKQRGSKIVKLLDTWETDTSYEAGYLAAAFDGDGRRGRRVVSKEFIGMQEVCAIKTSTDTFIAEGFASHNSSEKPRKLRGPQFHFAVADEAAFWTDAFKGTISDTTWSNLAIATRLPRKYNWPADYLAQICMATTPRPVALLTTPDPDPARAGLLQRETSIITKGRTTDNIDNLSDTYKANVIAPLIGTRLGRQELDGEILEDRADALWKREWIDSNRIAPSAVPDDLIRVVVAVDPAVSDGETAAETGIIVAGAGRNGRGYVLGDYTLRGSPKECMSEAIRVYNVHQADRIVAEINNGGDYIGNLIRMIDPDVPYRPVRATRGKKTRAEPVSALYEQGRIAHAGHFVLLEDQLCSWSPIDEVSPDRLDALTWAFTDLKDIVQVSWSQAYGVIKCSRCTRPFFRAVEGKERKACPHCGEPVKTAEEEDDDGALDVK